MGTNWGQIVKEQKTEHPGISDYTKCQSQAFVYATLSSLVVGSSVYAMSSLKPIKSSVTLKTRLLSAVLSGCFSAWYIATVRTKFCQEMWIAIEDKQTHLKTINNKKA